MLKIFSDGLHIKSESHPYRQCYVNSRDIFRGILTHLTRPCFKVIFHHPYFEDIGGMAYHRSYCDRLIAADVAVQPFHTVQAQRSRNPKPGLWENGNTLPRRLFIFCFVISNLCECLQDLI